MPRLLGTVARTAVIAGTASAVSGRVQRRQDERFAGRDAQLQAEREAAYEGQTATSTPSGSAGGNDTVQQLKDLAELKAQGAISDQEFAAAKAKILG